MADQYVFGDWGGYMDAKIAKLEQYTAASASFQKSALFAGISIYVNGLTNPSSDELKRIMMVHGGTYHHYERSHTTFIVASNLPDVKVRNMDTSKIISAKWIVDCVAANGILDYTQYLLYTNQKTTQPCLTFGKAKKEPEFVNETRSKSEAKIMEDLKVLHEHMCVKIVDKNDEKRDFNSNVEPKALKSGTGSARTADDPKFLPEFTGFKQYVSELREKHDGFPARLRLRELLHDESEISGNEYIPSNSTYVMHIDMDCFFVSVGLRKYPHLRGQPVGVTHSKGGSQASDVPVHPAGDHDSEKGLFVKRFEHLLNNILSGKVLNGFDAKMSLSKLASCSYEARENGVRNGMFVDQAIKLCPELKTIPCDFEGYKEVAYTLYDTVAQYTLQIEAVSCDEMFVDLTDVIRDLRVPPMKFVRFIRSEVREKTGCPCSAGVGTNKLQARMATKLAKPDGQFHLEVNNVEAFMTDILAEELPGVGWSTNYILKSAGYTTCGDLQRLTLTGLQELVGENQGETLYQFCRGIDNRPLDFEQTRKSVPSEVSTEVNYGIRFKEYADLETFLRQLCAEVHLRLYQINRKTKFLTLKVMVRAKEAPVETSEFMGHGVCDNITKSVHFCDSTNDFVEITRTVLTIMKHLNLPPHELRGIGIQLTKLEEPKLGHEQKENVPENMFNQLNQKRKEEEKSRAPMKRLNVFGMEDAEIKKYKFKRCFGPPRYVLPKYIDAKFFESLPLDERENILKEIEYQKAKQVFTKSKSSLSSVPLLSELFGVSIIPRNYFDEQPSTSRAALERRVLQKNNCEESEAANSEPNNAGIYESTSVEKS